MPQPTRESSGGTTHGPSPACQARAAYDENTGEKTMMLLEEALRRENLIEAHKRVVQNGGAAGVDGMTVDDLMPFCREHWPRIREELLAGTYAPQPVRRVEIPKPGGKGRRKLGIPTVLDRLIQQALHQVLTPIFDETFSEDSYGFRPGRSAHDAVRRAREHVASGYRWVVDLDLDSFFDRVHHDVLMARVARRVRDKRILRLIRRYLQAGVMLNGIVSPRAKGTPQGGPLSPLLSNILLDELDKELERRGHRWVRYADDVNVYVQTPRAGHRVMGSLDEFLMKRLRLRVNHEKSAVARPWTRKFLGYSFTSSREGQCKVAPTSGQRLKIKLKEIFRRGRGRSLDRVIREVNTVTRGWMQYFKLAEVKGVFEGLDEWIRRRMRWLIWRQWKTPRTRFEKLQALGVNSPKAARAAWGRDGPWGSSATSAINVAIPNRVLHRQGLMSLAQEHQRLARLS